MYVGKWSSLSRYLCDFSLRKAAQTANKLQQCWINDRGHLNFINENARNPFFRPPIDRSIKGEVLAFRHLGLVHIEFGGPTITIRWNVQCAGQEAIDAVLNFLDGCHSHRINLRFYYNGWISESYPDSQQAIQRIQDVSLYRDVLWSEDCLIHKQKISDIKDSTNLLQDAYASWEKSEGSLPGFDDDEHMEIFESMLIMVPNLKGDGLVMAHVGTQSLTWKELGADWSRKAVGKSLIRSGPMREYEEQVSPSYLEALKSGEPQHDHIRAIINREGREPGWFSYHRLLTPTTLLDGKPAVVCLTDISQASSIPFMDSAAIQ